MKKVGILGLAHGHVFAFGGEWVAHPEYGVQITGAWDHDAARLEKEAPRLKAKPFDTVEALLQSGIDAVVVASETAYHAELVEKAAAAKKDIILYKPMALTMAEADRIVEAVNKNGVRFTMGWQMRVDPQNVKIRELIASGELGKVCLYRRRHALSTHVWDGFENTWHNDPRLNRDIFADDSSHPIDMMQWLFGMPESVTCEMSTMVNPRVVNDNAVILFRYPNGLICEISCCFTCSASEITTEVYLDHGSIQQYFGDNPGCRLPRIAGMPGLKWYREGDADWTDSGIPSPAGHGQRLSDQARPFADFLNGGEPICTAEEGRNDLRLVLCCYLAAMGGKRVSVDDDRVYKL
ncbi:MAG: Gfo/Idh/MocA family oxidoreductase [Clostridia bacterium]|nr:Gfo/Idh/MocA family oxidoreductase [Clostridia bacterium]